IYFAPPLQGDWTWHVIVHAGGSYFTNLPGGPTELSFNCVPSTNRGPWRPAASPYQFTIEEPRGNGRTGRLWPPGSGHLFMLNPGYPPSSVCSYALDFDSNHAFNRIRLFLNYVENRAQPNPPNSATANHTVFAPNNSASDPFEINNNHVDF